MFNGLKFTVIFYLRACAPKPYPGLLRGLFHHVRK